MTKKLVNVVESESYIVSWTEGGRIKVEDKRTKTVEFVAFKKSALSKLLTFLDVKPDRDTTVLYFNSYAFDLLRSDHFVLRTEEGKTYICFCEETVDCAKKVYSSKRHGCQALFYKQDPLPEHTRYFLCDDGELQYFEDITPSNVLKIYDFPVVSVYKTKRNSR